MATQGHPAPVVEVSPDGHELAELVARLPTGHRHLLGIAGEPGVGKSTVARAVAVARGAGAAVVPMDGFHLADVTLDRLGLLNRKGAPETFDPWGYAALLERLRGRPGHTVYAPGFDRSFEQPVAGAVPVPDLVELVVTEGNYLLLDDPAWRAVRAALDQVWFVEADDGLRRSRLVARHEEFGKSAEQARRWVDRVDEPNALFVREGRASADLVLDVTRWTGQVSR